MGHNSNRLITAPTIKPQKGNKISVVIPAAGFGSRMKSYGPKSLIKIKNGMTIIDNQLKYIKRYIANVEIVVVAGFEFDKVKNFLTGNKNIKVVENADWETTNVVHSIGIGLSNIKYDNVLIVYGDLVFNAWTLKAPFGPFSLLLLDDFGLMKDEEVGCIANDNVVEQMMYGLPKKWSQIAYFTKEDAALLKRICCDKSNDKLFGFEVINMMINEGVKFIPYGQKRSRVIDIDSSRDMRMIGNII